MTKKNPHLWPKGSTLIIRDRYGELQRSADRRFDLADAIMLSTSANQRTVTLAILADDVWSREVEESLEEHIRYDLGFDGYGVTIKRETPWDDETSFQWKLRVRHRS